MNDFDNIQIPELAALNLTSKYAAQKILGQGGEGTVFEVTDKTTAERWVMKIFAVPISGTSANGLRIYADNVLSNEFGLPPIELIWDYDQPDQLIGIRYPFTPLHELHWRIVASFDTVAQAAFSAYCQMQSYLMSRCEIGLTDTVGHHFLMTEDGQFHFIDYGFAIKSIHHSRYLAEGRFGYSFAMLLLSLYNLNLREKVPLQTDYSYNQPCVYFHNKDLDEVARRHDWVKEILTEVRSRNASIFLEADFYQQLSERLPTRVAHPRLIIWANNSLFKTQRVLGRVRT